MPHSPKLMLVAIGTAAAAVLAGGVVVLGTGAAKGDKTSLAAGAAASPTPSAALTAIPTAPLGSTAAPGRTAAAAPTSAGAVTTAPTPAPSTAGGATSAAATPSASASASASKAKPGKTAAKPSATASTSAALGVGAKPGTYQEHTTGTVKTTLGNQNVDQTSALTVQPAQGTHQTQVTGDGSNNETMKLDFLSDRVDVAELSITSEVIDSDFVLDPEQPLAILKTGATWSWQATSTDGKEHLAFAGSYAGQEQVTIGGKAVTCDIIKATLTITGSISTTITDVDDYDRADYLDLRQHETAKGTYSGISYTADTTATLVSLTAS